MTKQDYLESKGLEVQGHNLLEEVDYEIQDMIYTENSLQDYFEEMNDYLDGTMNI